MVSDFLVHAEVRARTNAIHWLFFWLYIGLLGFRSVFPARLKAAFTVLFVAAIESAPVS
jgi:hypothetical protein